MNDNNVVIALDITKYNCSIVIGKDLKMNPKIYNLTSPPKMMMKHPTDRRERKLGTHMATDEPLRDRIRLLVISA